MGEVLHDVEAVSATNHAQPNHVVGRVEQVRAMRWGEHKVLVTVLGVIIESDVFSFLIEQEMSRGREALGQGGLTVKLMRELLGIEHDLGMGAGGFGETGVEGQ